MLLSKDAILKADDLPFRDIDVPEWGGVVRVGTMTAGDRDAFEASIYEGDGDKVKINRNDFRAKLLARALKDESGARLFSDKEIQAISAKSAKVVQKLFEVAQDMNGLSQSVQDDLEKK